LRTLPVISTAVLMLAVASGCASANRSAAGPTAAGCVPPTLNVSAALAGSRVTVSPAPQTRDASAHTQISFLGVPVAELSGITVSGSRSGPHPGSLEAYTQGDGASFLPTRPFSEGELVTVQADLTEGAQSVPFSWSFTVAVADTAHAAGAGTPIPPGKPGDLQSFVSRPDLKPPTVSVTAHATPTAPGDLFVAPYSGPGQYGPMILNENGELVWFKALSGTTRAADFRVQSYEGKPVLTWWQDPLLIAGHQTAGIVIDNSAYQRIATVSAGNGYQADLHEFQITPQGTAYLTVYNAIQCDLSAVKGPKDGAIADTIMQEIDLKTGLVMFEWHSVDHVPLSDSYSSARQTSLTTPFDFFHINSIDIEQDGHLLVDSRDTWAAYDVDPQSGAVDWTLGGKSSSFKMGPGTVTAFQHDARQQSDGSITFFDNGASPKIHPQSRAIEESLDMQNMTVTLVHRYEHPTPLLAGSQGNMQTLANGNWMVGWGQVPDFSEFSAAGALLFDAHLPSGYESYRAYRLPWSGQPSTPPALVLRAGPKTHLTGYASWNGATDIASWRVLEGQSASTLKPLATVKSTGFQSTIPIAGSPRYVAVQALGAGGAPLLSSAAVKAPATA
jgi:Arylsulfotransferase (ASST)